MKTIKYRRTSEIKLTNEARLLRKIRLDAGLSIREVGRRLGRSETFLRHIETGRLDVPKDEIVKQILNIYKVSFRQFKSRSKAVVGLDPYMELKMLLPEIPKSKLEVVLSVVRGLMK